MTNDGQPQAVSRPSSTSSAPPVNSTGSTMEDKLLLQSPCAHDSALLSFDDRSDGDGDLRSIASSSSRSNGDERFYDGKPILQGSPAKPMIMNGNALHLHLEERNAAGSVPSIRFAPDPPAISKPQGNDLETDASHLVRPSPRVRFRSRVRIASGLHRHRKHHPVEDSSDSSSSSRSSSPCSSLSAPLRYQADENSALGPLGKRLSAYAAAGGFKHRVLSSPNPQRQFLRAQMMGYGPETSEQTSLLRSGTRARSYGNTDSTTSLSGREHPGEADEGAKFGSWPLRLLNYHWWWWQLEPVLCCFCVEDSDTDE
ncbi:hypothetical protein OE88DRAFT_1651603 [Heliocybe sulcata]|uniref:Uncharacterized protein n=1 Tax=Heliocybe sulcata TaxID=5364 RepID=A0A5C3NK01_9AGAM|nr:hypothetical protein OE88DRAFT_1651603 [Heliocybe sulcata]